MLPVSANVDSPVKVAWFSYEARSIRSTDPSSPTTSTDTLLARGSADALRDRGACRRGPPREGVRWVFSFLTADKRKSHCVYEASSPDAILVAALRAGLPADSIVEVERVEAAMFT
jgi:hypothetical protein